MAEKRMFSKKITNSDDFLDMPLSSQCLYFHLSMNADDDGFVNNPKRTMRLIGASEDDMKLLIAKRFILIFESGVIVIKHWRINNTLKSDRYKPTDYKEELALLGLKENKSYTWKQNGNKMFPQNSIDKNSIDKNRLVESIRHKHGQYNHILLTDDQYQKLVNDLGEDKLLTYIRKVDEYVQMTGKKYKDYNLVIRKWVNNDIGKVREEESLPVYDTSKNAKLDNARLEEILEKRKKC